MSNNTLNYFYNTGTNGITYHSEIYPCEDLTEEEFKVASLFANTLTDVGVGGKSFEEMQKIQSAVTGGISASFILIPKNNNNYSLALQVSSKSLEKNLKQRLDALRNGLQTEYSIAKSKFDGLDQVLKSVRSDSIETQGAKYRPYRNALADLETERFIYNQLLAKHRQEIITMQLPRNPVNIIDVAEANLRPVSPNLFINVLISIFAGLGAGIGLAYFIEYLDTSVKTVEDVENKLKLKVLGLVPQKVRPLIEEGPDSENAESYRVLKTNLDFSSNHEVGGAYSIISAGAGEGKSTTVFNLAYVAAQQGMKVLLMDADLRRPVQHIILGMSNRFGLTNVLLRDCLLYTSPSPRDVEESRMPSSA